MKLPGAIMKGVVAAAMLTMVASSNAFAAGSFSGVSYDGRWYSGYSSLSSTKACTSIDSGREPGDEVEVKIKTYYVGDGWQTSAWADSTQSSYCLNAYNPDDIGGVHRIQTDVGFSSTHYT